MHGTSAVEGRAGEVDVMVNVFTMLPFDSQTRLRLTCFAWSRSLLGSRLSTRPWTLRVSSATPVEVVRGLCHGLRPQQLITDSPSTLWAAASPASGACACDKHIRAHRTRRRQGSIPGTPPGQPRRSLVLLLQSVRPVFTSPRPRLGRGSLACP